MQKKKSIDLSAEKKTTSEKYNRGIYVKKKKKNYSFLRSVKI